MDTREIVSHWGNGEIKEEMSQCIAGSPNRCIERHLFEMRDGRLLLLEGVRPDKRSGRERQALLLDRLSSGGLSRVVSPWMQTPEGEYGIVANGLFWQMRLYIPETENLPRDTYGTEAWRGIALAEVLYTMRSASWNIPRDILPNRFLLGDYIVNRLLPEIRRYRPKLEADVSPLLAELNGFLAVEEEVPTCFSHGDFHPGNVIWGQKEIVGLIDWEFCGPKIELYDAANLLGCLGMDNPEWLTAPLALSFVQSIREHALFAADFIQWLPECIAALRFGWLREWVHAKSLDMICQELDFIWLVLDNRELLKQKWCLGK